MSDWQLPSVAELRSRLAATDAAVAETEARYGRVALDHISGEPASDAALAEAQAALDKAKQRQRALALAIPEAERVEAARLAAEKEAAKIEAARVAAETERAAAEGAAAKRAKALKLAGKLIECREANAREVDAAVKALCQAGSKLMANTKQLASVAPELVEACRAGYVLADAEGLARVYAAWFGFFGLFHSGAGLSTAQRVRPPSVSDAVKAANELILSRLP